MEFTCGQCNGTGTYLEQSCPMCSGDGKINLLDTEAMKDIDQGSSKALLGVVWNEILTKITAQDVEIADIKDKVNDVMDKCNDIMEKLNE